MQRWEGPRMIGAPSLGPEETPQLYCAFRGNQRTLYEEQSGLGLEALPSFLYVEGDRT